ncbi:MAG: PLP-dependent aminotransferase family protein [Limisphaerales bacterium]
MNTALSVMGRRTAPPPISWLMQAALSRPKLISLAAGFTDNATLPVKISRQVLNRVLRSPKTGQPALQYGITTGETNLRQLTARHLQKLDQSSSSSSSSLERKSRTRTKNEDEDEKSHSWECTMITGGSQQLLYMTLEALCDEGDTVLVEDPTYFVFLSILQSRGLRARGVRLERDGLDLAHLEIVLQRLKKSGELRRVKALYLISYFHNPTGVTTSFEKKRGILKLLKKFERAAGHPIYLIEDAAYRELRFKGPDTKSALTVPGAVDRVIYTGTYSKPYAPGVRVGFGLLPEPLFTAVQHIKGNHDFGTANLLQQLLAGELETGLYDRHVAKIEKRYGQKARVMKQALAEHFPPNVEIWESSGGLYFWVRLPRNVSTGVKSKVFRTALKNDVLYVPGEICYADDPSRRKPDHEMRLSFGSASEENIREGIKRLGKVLWKQCP